MGDLFTIQLPQVQDILLLYPLNNIIWQREPSGFSDPIAVNSIVMSNKHQKISLKTPRLGEQQLITAAVESDLILLLPINEERDGPHSGAAR